MTSKPNQAAKPHRTLLNEAKISPSSVYADPREVVKSHVLTTDQKAEVLAQWEADAIAMQQASEEGMPGGAPSRLDEVHSAQTELREVTAGRAAASQKPTVISGQDARQGSTGHNVRTILAFSLISVIVAFILVGRYVGAF